MTNTKDSEPKKKGRGAGLVPPEVKEVVENSKLTDQEQLFCLTYVKCFNVRKAYMKAFDCDDIKEADSKGRSTLNKKHVQSEIKRLKKMRFAKLFVDEEDVLQKHIDIAFADITDVVEFGEEGAHLKDSVGVDGSVIAEIRFSGKGNVDVRMVDKQKSLDWLSNHYGQIDEEKKARIEKLKSEVKAISQRGAEETGVIIIPTTIINDTEKKK